VPTQTQNHHALPAARAVAKKQRRPEMLLQFGPVQING
jgi:hypothetical protein